MSSQATAAAVDEVRTSGGKRRALPRFTSIITNFYYKDAVIVGLSSCDMCNAVSYDDSQLTDEKNE